MKTNELKNAGIVVLAPSPQLKSGLATIGAVIAKEWAASAGADGVAMLTPTGNKRGAVPTIVASTTYLCALRRINVSGYQLLLATVTLETKL